MFMALVAINKLSVIIAWTEQELILLSQDMDFPFLSSNDANGNSRVQLIDWFSASGVTGSQMSTITETQTDMEHIVEARQQDYILVGLQMQEYTAAQGRWFRRKRRSVEQV